MSIARTGLGSLIALWLSSLVSLRAETPAATTPGDKTAPVSFLNEIMPHLTKAGCSSGGCHSKPEGQNNFFAPSSDVWMGKLHP